MILHVSILLCLPIRECLKINVAFGCILQISKSWFNRTESERERDEKEKLFFCFRVLWFWHPLPLSPSPPPLHPFSCILFPASLPPLTSWCQGQLACLFSPSPSLPSFLLDDGPFAQCQNKHTKKSGLLRERGNTLDVRRFSGKSHAIRIDKKHRKNTQKISSTSIESSNICTMYVLVCSTVNVWCRQLILFLAK